LRRALAESKNVPSVRLLRAITVPYAHEFIAKFGFDLARQPNNYTLALGTGAATPLQMAGAYAIFANGGYRVQPYLIARIEDADGKVIAETKPVAEHTDEQRVLDPRNAFITDSMLRDVTRYGTGAEATKALGRTDIAGKTGTTSDAMDGWFSGYGGNVVAVAWMGYDDPKSLGGKEFGATVALPIWIDYMRVALAKKPPQEERPQPDGVVRENDDWVYAEFAETPALNSVDLDQAPDPNAAPAEGAPPGTPAQPQQSPQPQQQQPSNTLF
jgi:penicillin-binding protein 1A